MISQEMLDQIREGLRNGFAITVYDEFHPKEEVKLSFGDKVKKAFHL